LTKQIEKAHFGQIFGYFVPIIFSTLSTLGMMKTQFTLVALALIGLSSCVDDIKGSLDSNLRKAIVESSKTGSIDHYIMPDSRDFNELPNQEPKNPITEEKVILGQQLFFETGLAQKPNNKDSYETYSCSSCHIPKKGFLPGRIQGIADGGRGFGDNGNFRTIAPTYLESDIDAQGNRPLTVMNVTYMTNTSWSGTFGANDQNIGTEQHWTDGAEVNNTGFVGLEAQNIEGLHVHRMEINNKVLYEYGYAELFDKAFHDIPESERYNATTASFAISAYLRTILTNQNPFQDFLKGDNKAMTRNQKEGGLVFFKKAECFKCHNSPSLGAMKFYALGTRDLYEMGGVNTSADDPRILGRASFTKEENDMYKFKVPQLYNLRDYSTFFHGSSKNSIEEVVDYKIAAHSENSKVSDESMPLTRLELTEEEKSDLIDFLTYALYDYDIERYVPQSVKSGKCFPNNDAQSKEDMGCK